MCAQQYSEASLFCHFLRIVGGKKLVSTRPNELRTGRAKLSYFDLDLEMSKTVGFREISLSCLEAQESCDSFRIGNIGYF